MRIVSITAGAAGMFCGSCLHDNTLAAALIRLGHDCLLLSTFTPLTLDEPDQSSDRVFLGGVNVFLDETAPPAGCRGSLAAGLTGPASYALPPAFPELKIMRNLAR